MKTLEQLELAHTSSLEKAEKVYSEGVAIARASFERLLSFYENQKANMIAASNKRLEDAKKNLELRLVERAKKEEAKQLEKQVKSSKPRVRRTKEEIEIQETKERLDKQREESWQRHLDNQSSNTEQKISSVDRNRVEVFGGVSSFLGFDEEEEEQKLVIEDEWDIEDMSYQALKAMVDARKRANIEIPSFVLEKMEGLEVAAKPITTSNSVQQFEEAAKKLQPPEPKVDTEPNPLADPPAKLGLTKPFTTLPQTSEPPKTALEVPILSNTKIKKLPKQVR